MINNLKAGDTIYVTDLTRITRSTKDLFLLIEKIKSKGANLKSLKDIWIDLSESNSINCTTYQGQFKKE